MAENRAAKSGIARDVQQKINAKYEKGLAAQCMTWLAGVVTDENIDTSGDADAVYECLQDGFVLCKLADKLKPGCVGKKAQKKETMTFKMNESVEMFTKAMKAQGIPDHEVFAVADLREKQNMWQVITMLATVARKSEAISGGQVKGFGPKEAEANKREFTEEQLNQGKSVIGLQMGTNKGANQSGVTFGKSRMITD
ncbi:myophilin-like [Babylonia areolata]|uniref:myophilin-like n=1 Tax=Babylonia areolata TaxID=304850 RepID=UPI003FCF3CA5